VFGVGEFLLQQARVQDCGLPFLSSDSADFLLSLELWLNDALLVAPTQSVLFHAAPGEFRKRPILDEKAKRQRRIGCDIVAWAISNTPPPRYLKELQRQQEGSKKGKKGEGKTTKKAEKGCEEEGSVDTKKEEKGEEEEEEKQVIERPRYIRKLQVLRERRPVERFFAELGVDPLKREAFGHAFLGVENPEDERDVLRRYKTLGFYLDCKAQICGVDSYLF